MSDLWIIDEATHQFAAGINGARPASKADIVDAARTLDEAFERTAYGRPAQLGQVVPGHYLVIRLGDSRE